MKQSDKNTLAEPLLEQSDENKVFSALRGLKKFSEPNSSSSFSKKFNASNTNVYRVRDGVYGLDAYKWVGGTVRIDGIRFPSGEIINGIIFPNGKGSLYNRGSIEGIEKEMGAFQADNNFFTGEWEESKKQGHGVVICLKSDSPKGKLEKFFDLEYHHPEINWETLYGNGNDIRITKWEGGIIERNGRIFAHGKGYFHYEDGTRIEKTIRTSQDNNNFFTGEWGITSRCENGMLEGWGRYFYKNRDYYEGRWANGRPEGQGKFIFADCSSYKGEWKNGEKHGKGTYISKDRVSYKGTYENGIATDFSEIIIPDRNGKLHTITKKDGLCFYKVGEKEIEIDIENEKRLKSILLQFGNEAPNQKDVVKMKNPEDLQKFIEQKRIESENANQDRAKPYVIEISGCPFTMFFEKGGATLVDSGGLRALKKGWQDVIRDNKVECLILQHEPNLKFNLIDGSSIDIPIYNNALHVNTAVLGKLEELRSGLEENKKLSNEFVKYLTEVSKKKKSSGYNLLNYLIGAEEKPGLLIRINSSDSLRGNDSNYEIVN